MAEVPVIQVLQKAHYATQALVPVPSALPLPALADSSLRVRTEVLSLTMNNLSYARLGDLLHWWDVHPLPAGTPAPYGDAARYGRTNCWGYARVLESTCAAAPAGSHIFGYLPLGTLPQDLRVAPALPAHLVTTSPHRRHVLDIYNRYLVVSDIAAQIAAKSTPVALDALLRIMHLTAYLIAEHVFAADPGRAIPPSSAADASAPAAWSPTSDADLSGASVVVFAPGSKAALALAWILRRRRDGGAGKPRRVVGVASPRSVDFVRATGLYDDVLVSSDVDALALSGGERVVVFEFGGRGGAAAAWTAALRDRGAVNLLFVVVGAEQPVAAGGQTAGEWGPQAAQLGRVPLVRVNADSLRLDAVAKVGERAFYADLDESWARLREEGIRGFRVTWGEGMEDVKEGWDRLNRGDLGPEEGLVYKI
ncbi:hypothetical protein F4775DRAFT_487933 [Biscogniauxia sp. FL1348]|nr:hypothetical protein F4775DRAFT_487933 [Biscogniauxia sp. FL1348]